MHTHKPEKNLTPEEIKAGITSCNSDYPVLDVKRYGAVGDFSDGLGHGQH